MTPAERKFTSVEGGLMRARSLVKVLRHISEIGLDAVDTAMWNGVAILASDAEDALDAAAEVWAEAQAKIGDLS